MPCFGRFQCAQCYSISWVACGGCIDTASATCSQGRAKHARRKVFFPPFNYKLAGVADRDRGLISVTAEEPTQTKSMSDIYIYIYIYVYKYVCI